MADPVRYYDSFAVKDFACTCDNASVGFISAPLTQGNQMKLCKDCKWMVEPGEYARCTIPKNINELPTGFVNEPRWRYCTTMRSESYVFAVLFKMCGKSGRWYEPKEPQA